LVPIKGAYTTALKSGAKTLGEMFPASNRDLFLDKGAKATAEIAKSTVKNLGALGAGGGAAVAAGQLAAASTLATTLGIGLVSAGAAVKLIRIKGKKSSRAQLLSDLSKELQPFDVPDSQQAIDPPMLMSPLDLMRTNKVAKKRADRKRQVAMKADHPVRKKNQKSPASHK
jgi:hypothetical protein